MHTRSHFRCQSQNTIDFPKRKSVRIPHKQLENGRISKRDLTPLSISPRPSQEQVLPLSPRKRLGDDNLCNVTQLLSCSPTKQSKKENSFSLASPKGRRLLFSEPSTAKIPPENGDLVPSPIRRGQGTPKTPLQERPKKKLVCTHLFKQDGTCYQQAKSLLHTAVPDQLHAREKEIGFLHQFLKEHVCGGKPGSLYISGPPGTGKTACLSKALLDLKGELAGSKIIVLNCMALLSSRAVFPAIAKQLGQTGAEKNTPSDIVRKLEKRLTASSSPMVLVVLDEMDQLDSKGQDVLYTMFGWPFLPSSNLVLIGIANALDLTDRILPRLQACLKCRPQLLNFPPYNKDQLASILEERLKEVPGEQVLDRVAIQFCSRKVAAVSGDARKALDICRRAIEVVEMDVKSQTLLKQLSDCKSPSKPVTESPVPKRVGLVHVSQVISEVYGNRMTAGNGCGDADSFPLQQKMLVCSLLLLTKQQKAKEVTLGKLHEAYSKVCKKQQVGALDQSECLSLSSLLESRSILGLKKAKDVRLTKVFLKIDEKDIEHALKDGVLVGKILAGGL